MNKELEAFEKMSISHEISSCYENHYKTKKDSDYLISINPDWEKEIDIVKNALKRNEAMKVINGINYKGQDVMLCPNCERNAGKINDRYCSHCGQALDWSG